MRLKPESRWAFVLSWTLVLGGAAATAQNDTNPQSSGHARIPSRLNQTRGLYAAPFRLSAPEKTGARLYFTTNGSAPSPERGQPWPGSLEITGTTTLRLAQFDAGTPVGPTETHTYLFPNQVVQQTGAGLPSNWGFTNGQPVHAFYGMAPHAAASPEALDLALRSLPALSIVMDSEDLFGSARGLYAHPQESGVAWERPASVEWIDPAGRQGFQIDGGIRMQGGWNRRPEESPKHAFRLVFNKRYAQPLHFLLFGSGVSEFETVILRAGCNNTWLHWSGEERRRGDYLRDQWMRDTVREMGHPEARGRFVHLYLNGLYWGLYDLCERPSAPFVAAHLGGAPKNYDVRNGNHNLEGSEAAWNQLLRVANRGVTGQEEYVGVQQLLDIPAFIDYMMANLYGSNADWDGASNWYAARRRKPAGQFQFFVWDAERTLEDAHANTLDTDDDQSPTRLFQALRKNPAFRREFAARAEKHLGHGGALSPAAAAARWKRLAEAIDPAIVAESARWGNYRHDVHPYKTGPFEIYTRDEHWRPEIDRLLREYFPQRSGIFLEQLRAVGLYSPEED